MPSLKRQVSNDEAVSHRPGAEGDLLVADEAEEGGDAGEQHKGKIAG